MQQLQIVDPSATASCGAGTSVMPAVAPVDPATCRGTFAMVSLGCPKNLVDTERMLGLLRSIVELPKPVVARVDGAVRAGGVGLVGACDIAIVSPATSFAFTEVRLGLTPAIISITTLGRMTSRARGGSAGCSAWARA